MILLWIRAIAILLISTMPVLAEVSLCHDLLQFRFLQTSEANTYINRLLKEALQSRNPNSTLYENSRSDLEKKLISLAVRGETQSLEYFALAVQQRLERLPSNLKSERDVLYRKQTLMLAALYIDFSNPRMLEYNHCHSCLAWPSLSRWPRLETLLDIVSRGEYGSKLALSLLTEQVAIMKSTALTTKRLNKLKQDATSSLNRINEDSTEVELAKAYRGLILLATFEGPFADLVNPFLAKLSVQKIGREELQFSLQYVILNSPQILSSLNQMNLETLITSGIPSSIISKAKGIRFDKRLEEEGSKANVYNNFSYGYSDESLYTNFDVFRAIVKRLQLPGGSRIVDVGAGEARLGLIVGEIFPELFYSGVELDAPRILPAKESLSKFPNVEVRIGSFTDKHVLPVGDVYYIFNPSNDLNVMASLFRILHEISLARKIKIVVTSNTNPFYRGTDAIQKSFPWLMRQKDLEADSFHHVYESIP